MFFFVKRNSIFLVIVLMTNKLCSLKVIKTFIFVSKIHETTGNQWSLILLFKQFYFLFSVISDNFLSSIFWRLWTSMLRSVNLYNTWIHTEKKNHTNVKWANNLFYVRSPRATCSNWLRKKPILVSCVHQDLCLVQ